ncbi:MAG TPA: peptidoglycan editing factor PgeF [Candidatus Acidoferrales bacterium]|nr:peptidoglycan editing factor PgeF [Candidatus Acidoferrales bacterium]
MAVTKLRSKPKTRLAQDEKSPAKVNWHTSTSDGLQIIYSKPLERFNWLVHGFSTRPGGESLLENPSRAPGRSEKVLNLGITDWDSPERVESNRRRFIGALSKAKFSLATLRQIHSDITHLVESQLDEPPTGDALLTSNRGLLLAVQTADCIPILLVDPRHRAVAAVHAGWRGTVARIAAKTLGRMQMEFATRPADLLAALGPGIHPCCYEVGPEVVKEFVALFPDARNWFDGPFEILASGEDPNPLPWLSMMPPGHYPPPPRCHLDLYAANAAILAEAGLKPKNIFCSDLCTSCRTDLLFSFRREGRTGRLMAVIGIV